MIKLADIPAHERERKIRANLTRWFYQRNPEFQIRNFRDFQISEGDPGHYYWGIKIGDKAYSGTATLSIGSRGKPPLKCRLFFWRES